MPLPSTPDLAELALRFTRQSRHMSGIGMPDTIQEAIWTAAMAAAKVTTGPGASPLQVAQLYTQYWQAGIDVVETIARGYLDASGVDQFYTWRAANGMSVKPHANPDPDPGTEVVSSIIRRAGVALVRTSIIGATRQASRGPGVTWRVSPQHYDALMLDVGNRPALEWADGDSTRFTLYRVPVVADAAAGADDLWLRVEA